MSANLRERESVLEVETKKNHIQYTTSATLLILAHYHYCAVSIIVTSLFQNIELHRQRNFRKFSYTNFVLLW